jgi:hypothetical protein
MPSSRPGGGHGLLHGCVHVRQHLGAEGLRDHGIPGGCESCLLDLLPQQVPALALVALAVGGGQERRDRADRGIPGPAVLSAGQRAGAELLGKAHAGRPGGLAAGPGELGLLLVVVAHRASGLIPGRASSAENRDRLGRVVRRLAPTVRSRRAERPQAALWTRCTRSASPVPAEASARGGDAPTRLPTG